MEANASNYYLYISSWCKVNGYDGASAFFQNHSTEERDHMLKIINYLNDLKIPTTIPSIEKPKQNMKSLEQVFKTSLVNEQKVTKSIDKIIHTAQNENDYRTSIFLNGLYMNKLKKRICLNLFYKNLM